jgi:hypothetical protein
MVTPAGTNAAYAVSNKAPNTVGTWDVQVTFTVPADALRMAILLTNGSLNVAEPVYWDAALLVEGDTAPSYFDGDTTDTNDFDYAWSDDRTYSVKYNRVWRRVKYEAQIGEFQIDSINTSRFPNQISVSGRDYSKRLQLDQFPRITAFAAGSKLDATIRTIALNAGILKFRLNAPSAVLGAQATFARSSSRWDAIKSMCDSLNIEVYFDREGYLVTREYSDISTSVPVFVLSTDEASANIVDFSKSSSDSNIFNDVIVVCTSEEASVTGDKFLSIKTNTDPDSPTNITKIGRRTLTWDAPYLTSQAQAVDLANRLFQVSQLEDFQLTFSAVCLPWLEAGGVVQFDDPEESDYVPTRFLFTDFNIPLGLGAMSGTGKRIVIAGSLETDQSDVKQLEAPQ